MSNLEIEIWKSETSGNTYFFFYNKKSNKGFQMEFDEEEGIFTKLINKKTFDFSKLMKSGSEVIFSSKREAFITKLPLL